MTEPTPKTLLGPGPSNVHPRVYSAMSGPVLSHMDPDFWAIMDETVELLREVFQTGNGLTLPISGTGSAGMEAALYNSLEPGDTVVVGVAGFFASRIVEIAQRCEANVVPVEAEWGKAVPAAAVEEALAGHPETKVVALVHCETSTGVLQPLEEIGQLARAHGAHVPRRQRSLPRRTAPPGRRTGNRHLLQRQPEVPELSPGSRAHHHELPRCRSHEVAQDPLQKLVP